MHWSLLGAALLVQCALVAHCDTTSVTLCNLLPNSTAVFAPALPLDSAAVPSTCGSRLSFAQCCEISGVPFPFRALRGASLDRGFDPPPSGDYRALTAHQLLQSPQPVITAGWGPGDWTKSLPLTAVYWGKALPFPRRLTRRLWVPLFLAPARNYGFLVPARSKHEPGLGARWVTPSATFTDTVPAKSTRYVWQNLCHDCGQVSAFVNHFVKRINPAVVPMVSPGDPFDEVEALPGPPKGAAGVFTTFDASGKPGTAIAPIRFPFSLDEFSGKEPYFALLAVNLTVCWVDGMQPVLDSNNHPTLIE